MRMTIHATHITDRGPQSKDEHVEAANNVDAIDIVKGKYPAALIRGVIPSVADHNGKYPDITIGDDAGSVDADVSHETVGDDQPKRRGMPKGGWPKRTETALEGEE